VKVNELIAVLQKLAARHGDVRVLIEWDSFEFTGGFMDIDAIWGYGEGFKDQYKSDEKTRESCIVLYMGEI
jgi:hypothetical protein